MLTNKILKFSFFALSLLLILLPAVLQAQTITDSTELYTLVKTYQDTFNTRSAKALSAFFTEDADVVVGNLLEAKGRQAIENFWRNYWRSKFNKQQPVSNCRTGYFWKRTSDKKSTRHLGGASC